MKLACFGLTWRRPAQPLEAQRVDEPAGRVALGVAEDAAGRRLAQGLVGLAPAADLVEPRRDDRGSSGCSSKVAASDDFGPARGRVLEAGLAVGHAELVRAHGRLAAVGA